MEKASAGLAKLQTIKTIIIFGITPENLYLQIA